MKAELILVGGGGHCKSCIDVIEQERKFSIAGVVDISQNQGQRVLGYNIIATDNDLPELIERYSNFFITIGQIKSPQRRIELFEVLKRLGARLPVIISPYAYVSTYVDIGEGTIIMHRAIVNAGAQIGKNCIINTASLIEHEASIGDHSHVATSAVVNGSVRLGNGVFIGSNTVIREHIEIGENSTVGAGLRIMSSLPHNSFIRS